MSNLMSEPLSGFCMASLLEESRTPTLVLSEAGSILYSNHSASKLLRLSARIEIVEKSLFFSDELEQASFYQELTRIVQCCKRGYSSHSFSLLLGEKKSRETLLCASILKNRGSDSICVLLKLYDPRVRALPSAQQIKTYFSLSEAESEVCADLVAGLSLSEIAIKQNKSEKTLRSYLKHAYQKTGCHRQGHLVARVLVALLDSSDSHV